MILIRADANENIGSGHVMRCLSIANALVRKEEKVLFITADHKADKLIKQRGFERICLESDWSVMDQEIPVLRGIIERYKPSLLLIDSYYVTEYYFIELGRLIKTAYIDDLNEKCWSVNYLINYNIYSTCLDYSKYNRSKTELILGTENAPLRDEFRRIEQHAIKNTIEEILVSAGGSDPEKITERLIENVCPKWPAIRFHFVVGSLNPRINGIKKLKKNNIVLHINEKNMSALMKNCDVAIAAAGSTLYELCACGVPTLTYTLADNQLAAAKEFNRRGIMINAGDCRGNERFASGLNEILEILDKEKRLRLSINMQTLVDGCGADRIAEKLLR